MLASFMMAFLIWEQAPTGNQRPHLENVGKVTGEHAMEHEVHSRLSVVGDVNVILNRSIKEKCDVVALRTAGPVYVPWYSHRTRYKGAVRTYVNNFILHLIFAKLGESHLGGLRGWQAGSDFNALDKKRSSVPVQQQNLTRCRLPAGPNGLQRREPISKKECGLPPLFVQLAIDKICGDRGSYHGQQGAQCSNPLSKAGTFPLAEKTVIKRWADVGERYARNQDRERHPPPMFVPKTNHPHPHPHENQTLRCIA